jgi:hypothetical protein
MMCEFDAYGYRLLSGMGGLFVILILLAMQSYKFPLFWECREINNTILTISDWPRRHDCQSCNRAFEVGEKYCAPLYQAR